MREIPPAIYEKIGRIVERWAYIDMVLGDILIHFTHGDPGAMLAITQTVAASTITGWIRTLAEPRVPTEKMRHELTECLARIDALRGDRNAYVHGLWDVGPNDETATLKTVKWDRSEIVRVALVTVEDTADFLTETGLALDEIIKILGYLRGAAPP